ncbi:hypothetical protein ACHAXH_009892 [Discostella pseudostelligera]
MGGGVLADGGHFNASPRKAHRSHSHSILWITIAASICSASNALSFFKRNAQPTLNNIHQREINTAFSPLEYEPISDFSGTSPPYPSNLHSSATYSHDRNSRQRIISQHNRRFFRREGNFQLNYKDYDDDFLSLLEGQESLRSRIFRGWRRKSLTKALFPSSKDERNATNRLDMKQDKEEAVPLPTTQSKPDNNNFRRKKRNKVVVSNIQELHEAILDKKLELRDVELNYSPPPSLLTSKKDCPSDTALNPALVNSDDLPIVSTTNIPEYNVVESEIGDGDLESPFLDVEIDENDEPNAEEWQMIGNVLAEDNPFLTDTNDTACEQATTLFSHDVLNLLHQRYHSKSTPMNRSANDTAILALAIEGGGMRGAVSGGMAAAIACLGLSDAFDKVYGSSAGSIIGSYFVSRQLYLDVYTDVIPAGKNLFVNKGRIIGDIFRNMFYVMRQQPLGKRLNANVIERFRSPATEGNITISSTETLRPTRTGGLNTSFVLDSIMCPERGLRPLDLDAFAHNDAVQPLRIGSSAVELDTGKLKSICFGSKEGHFKDQFANPGNLKDSTSMYPEKGSAQADENGYRHGLWACLGASMTVPGAAGSPLRVDLPSSDTNQLTPHLCFDAFCYEPVPYRSAVAEGATHVVALRSRPAGFEPKTKPTLYEQLVAPLYLRSNGAKTVAEFFEKGGQQYLYAEDVLTCDLGLNSSEPIPIPPAKVLYAAPEEQRSDDSSSQVSSDTDRSKWSRAHLLPITVPADVAELSTLSQDRDEILAGIRAGFAAAYESLAPVVGLDSLNGMMIAELVFPDADAHHSVLDRQRPLAGEKLGKSSRTSSVHDIISARANVKESTVVSAGLSPARYLNRGFGFLNNRDTLIVEDDSRDHDARRLFSFLPGVQLGSLPLVAERLESHLERISCLPC